MSADDISPDWKGYGLDQLTAAQVVRRLAGHKSADSVEDRANSLTLNVAALCDKIGRKTPVQVQYDLGEVIIALLALCAQQEVRLDKIADAALIRLSASHPQPLGKAE
jgi:hypothetical protein